MSTAPLVTRRWLWPLLIATTLIAGIALGLAITPAVDAEGKARPAPEVAAEIDRVVIETQPSVSTVNAGFDQERVWGQYNDWEPAIAVDPSSSYVYQLTTRYNGPEPCNRCAGPYIIFRRSHDGGATWEPDKFLTPYRKAHNDPQIEVANDGTIYAAWLNDYVPGIKFLKSSNHGDTWSAPIAITTKAGQPNWSDKPILAISPTGRDVYIAFNASDAYVVVSHNFGATFSKPIKTNNDTRYWFHNGGAVAPNGDVYFSAVDYSQDYTGDSYINVLKSTNGGKTWTTTRVDTSKQMPDCAWAAGCSLGFFGPSAALAIDTAGTIMIAYNAGDVAGQPQKMWARTSTNGVTWSARQELSNGATTVNNGFPALATGPTAGDFRVAWQDDRNGSTTAWNTWYRSTNNSGTTWSAPIRLSDLGTGAPYKNTNGYAFPYGDYFEVAVDAAGMAHVIWGEGTSYTGPGGTWYTRGR
ncbi:MAG: sialidase family protein [Anaerolineae bacterium]